MTATELIGLLRKMPPDALVVIPGYENGFDPVLEIAQMRLVPQRTLHSWDGVLDAAGLDVEPRECVTIGKRSEDAGYMQARLSAADVTAEHDDDSEVYVALGWDESTP
jgi:hypothetical protein